MNGSIGPIKFDYNSDYRYFLTLDLYVHAGYHHTQTKDYRGCQRHRPGQQEYRVHQGCPHDGLVTNYNLHIIFFVLCLQLRTCMYPPYVCAQLN